MSDVVLDQRNVNGQPSPVPGGAPEAQSEGSNFDFVQILWRWKWLPILGSIVGACLGFLYFSRLPETFEAAARVQVISSIPAPVKNPYFSGGQEVNRIDESMIIRSQAVLRLAVSLGRLGEQPEFVGLASEDIVSALQDVGSPLVIEPADKDDQTTLIRIAYVSEDAETAAKVVHAVVEGYEKYLADEYKTVGEEIAQLMEGAHADLTKRMRELSESASQFKEANPDIVFIGDDVNDPYHATWETLHKKLIDIRSRKSEIDALTTQVRKSLNKGHSPESLMRLLAMVSGGGTASANGAWDLEVFRQEQAQTRIRTDEMSRRLEQEQLNPLRIQLEVFSNQLGEEHPSVATLRAQVQGLEKQLEKIREGERLYKEELEKNGDALARKTGAEIRSIEERLEERLLALEEQSEVFRLEEEELANQAERERRSSRELQGMLDGYRILQTDRDAVSELLTAYTEKLQEIDLMPKMGQRTLKRLDMPNTGLFYGPKVIKYLVGGAAVGFILLSGLAVLMDLADRSYKNPSEISTDLGVSVLGHIPVMNLSKVKKSVEAVDPAVCAIHHSKGRVAEAYRSVRTGLYFSNKGKALKVIQVTSPVPGDGKSTLSSNISVTMAQSGRRVLLIDADLRRPRVAKIFGIDSEIGVAAVVGGKVEVDDAICAGPVANLSILPGGKRPANPAEILSSERFRNMIDMLRDKFDVIVVDTPPLLAVSDPGAVAGIVDGVLMTMRLRRNVKPLALRAKSILEGVGANLLGVVINGVSSEAGYGYNYDYNDYRYAYKYGSNYRSGYGYRYGYGNYRYGYSEYSDTQDLSVKQPGNPQ
ncbi:MAG TPA: hypothetical protein DDW52_26760 [Planctomycetaceae bacterium]|nr:hypothetical protein [Planctomycetaceae bacterium]